MDDRAYHLQNKARGAVAVALTRGDLTRQPCEACGARGQAHHDSYHPEKWLAVRWLCPKHHREWHDHNEPEWPTIYDYHPSDEVDFGMHWHGRRRGRPPGLWFRKGTQSWYTTLGGKQHCMGNDRQAALARLDQLVSDFTARNFGKSEDKSTG